MKLCGRLMRLKAAWPRSDSVVARKREVDLACTRVQAASVVAPTQGCHLSSGPLCLSNEPNKLSGAESGEKGGEAGWRRGSRLYCRCKFIGSARRHGTIIIYDALFRDVAYFVDPRTFRH
jgi:hypothetical protein